MHEHGVDEMEGMEQLVFKGYLRSKQKVVLKLDGIMANVKPLQVSEVPGVACGSFGMDKDAAACWSHWRGIKVVGPKKVFPHGYLVW